MAPTRWCLALFCINPKEEARLAVEDFRVLTLVKEARLAAEDFSVPALVQKSSAVRTFRSVSYSGGSIGALLKGKLTRQQAAKNA